MKHESCRRIFSLIREKKIKNIRIRIRENTQFTGSSKSWGWRCTSRESYQKRIITRACYVVTCSSRAVNFWLFLQMSHCRNRRMLVIAWYTAIKRNEQSRWPTTVVRVYFIRPEEIRRDVKLSNNDIQDDRDLSNQNDERSKSVTIVGGKILARIEGWFHQGKMIWNNSYIQINNHRIKAYTWKNKTKRIPRRRYKNITVKLKVRDLKIHRIFFKECVYIFHQFLIVI